MTANTAGVWTAIPDTNVTWSSKVLYISNITGEVGFTDSGNSSDIIMSGFQAYDKNTLLRVGSHSDSLWHVQDTDIENVWTVGWGNADDDDSLTAVQLRGVAPTQDPIEGDGAQE